MSTITWDISQLPEELKIQLIEFYTQLERFNSQVVQLPGLRDNQTRLTVLCFNIHCLEMDLEATRRTIIKYANK